jgi:hypothetical protein
LNPAVAMLTGLHGDRPFSAEQANKPIAQLPTD